VSLHGKRQDDREGTALTWLALDADRAPMEFDDLFRERKAQPGTLVTPRGPCIELLELDEQLPEILWLDADAGIAHLQSQPVRIGQIGDER